MGIIILTEKTSADEDDERSVQGQCKVTGAVPLH